MTNINNGVNSFNVLSPDASLADPFSGYINKTAQAAQNAAEAEAALGFSEAKSASDTSISKSTDILNPFISNGTDAYNQYLDALGITRQLTPGTAATPATAATPGQAYNKSVSYFSGYQPNRGGDAQGQYNFNKAIWDAAHPGTAGSSAVAAVAPTYTTPDTQSILQRFMNSPGYQAMYQQGLNALNSSASAQGLLGSGAQGQALEKFGANYAQTGYQNYLTNLNTAVQPGATAAGQLSGDITSSTNALQGAATGTSSAATNAIGNIAGSNMDAIAKGYSAMLSSGGMGMGQGGQGLTMGGVGAVGAGSALGTGLFALPELLA